MYNKLKLLQESENTNNVTKALVEEAFDLQGNKVKKLKVVGTAIVCDIPGINGRSYPKRILESEVKRFNDKFIKKGRGIAELNHPRLTNDGEGKDYSVFEINLMKACAVIEELYFEGNNLLCKMVVVENHPAGQALKSLIEAGYTPGYSLRGAGSVVDTGKGHFEVDDDYRLITIDVVGNPSFDDKALISGIYESNSKNNIKVLTESVHIVEKEVQHNIMMNNKIKNGYRTFNKTALESVMRSYNNIVSDI